jgi:hypothetical protein
MLQIFDADAQLIISEYLEGTSNNKCIELFNTTGADINLSSYSLRRYTNGTSNPTTIPLSGTITSCGTHVICNSSSEAALLAITNQTSGSLSHNGDDAYDLFDGSSVIDVFGDIGCDPGSEWTAAGTNGTKDNSYIRNTSICVGVSDPTGACSSSSFTTLATEWTSTNSNNDYSDLGSHTTTCPACSAPTITITTGTVTGNPFTVDCAGTTDAGTIDFTSIGTFIGGNIYTAQLSDAAGSFASPTSIGTLASTANSGTINITIPAGTASGSGYLIRVISDNPVTTGSSSAVFTITQTGTCGPTLPAGLIINEWSNGPAGSQEYYEFVVAGQCGELVDIRGYILDDNNGTFTTPASYSGTASGIAPGHFRFAFVAQWASIPVGSLILIYNANDPNTDLPADDPTDANNDSLYVVPHNNALFERCLSMPIAAAPDSLYTPCTYTVSPLSGWGALSLRNSGDAIQVRQPDGTYYQGVSYGGSEISGGPNNLKLFTGSGSAMAGWFTNGDFFDISNWTSGAANVTNQTAGLANNALNQAWLLEMRDSQTENCPFTILPVEITLFEGWNEPYGNKIIWETATEKNSDYFVIDRSIDGKSWIEVQTIKSVGNSETISKYSTVDIGFEEVMNYYRLSQYDLDGTEKRHYKSVTIDNSIVSDIELIGIYNILGQPVTYEYKGLQIHVFSNGTSKKVFH